MCGSGERQERTTILGGRGRVQDGSVIERSLMEGFRELMTRGLKPRCLPIVVCVFLVAGAAVSFAADSKVKRTIETEVVRLAWSGFEPARILRPKGSFRLFVQSAWSMPTHTLVLESESKAVLKTKTMGQAPRGRWVEDHNLPPGTYFLRVQELPNLRLQIVIR